MMSFLGLSIFGAVLLMLPISNSNGEWLSPVDAFFMSVSSACVTGLVVLDIGTDLTIFGQLVILFLIQVGGLGYMTLTTLLIYLVGKRLSISESKIFKLANNSELQIDIKDFIIKIGLLTLACELIGAVLLLKDSVNIVLTNNPETKTAYLSGAFHAIFHSISAFCNAGLCLYSNGLESHHENYFFLLIFSSLIILGGLGYTVLHEVLKYFDKNKVNFSLTLHTKIALKTTCILLISGLVIQFALIYIQDLPTLVEHGLSLKDKAYEIWHNLWVAFFQTCSARTAGFNSVSINDLGEASHLFLIVWMFIGACPGSTAGGIKVTTLVVIFATIYSSVKNKEFVKVGNRSITQSNQRKAIIVFVSAVAMIIFFTWILFIIEGAHHFNFLDQLFEVTSAFNTVGLSTGITGKLSDPSLILLTICMLIGRPGPLLFLMAIIPEEKGKELRCPEEGILIG